MPKILECDLCLFCAHGSQIVYALHPDGVEFDSCLDFRAYPELEGKHFKNFLGWRNQQRFDERYSHSHENEDPDQKLWSAESACYYNGELILHQPPRWTQSEQMELLDTHPLFTGKCPDCGAVFNQYYIVRVHWDCSECGWMDDTV